MKGNLIAIEGLDVVGKTTLAKIVCEQTGAIYYRTPPKQYLSRCLKIDEGAVNFSEDRLNLFIDSVRFASQEIKSLADKGESVIADRWIWTTLAYHFAGNNDLYKKMENSWQSIVSKIVKPSLSLLVVINDEQIWLERIRVRNKLSNCDKLLVENKNLRERILYFFQKLNPEFHLINNSTTIGECVKNTLSLINSK